MVLSRNLRLLCSMGHLGTQVPKTRGGWEGGTRRHVSSPAPLSQAVTRPLSHSPEPGDEGEPGRTGLELEPEEPPGWRELVPAGTLHSLPKSQVKRQEVISGECPPAARDRGGARSAPLGRAVPMVGAVRVVRAAGRGCTPCL